MKHRLNNHGFIKGAFILLLIGGLIYAGVSFGIPYYRYYALKIYSQDFLKLEPRHVKERVMESVKELHAPITEGDVVVTQLDRTVTLNIVWSEIIDFFGYYQYKLDFAIDLTQDQP